MGKKILIDPLTRIEGHLGIEVEVESGHVVSARSKGNLFRGIELILKGRDPRDALHLTQRICGVCSASHGVASAVCLEDAASITVPFNAHIIRSLILGSNYLHSHLTHFYHLSCLDFVEGPDVAPFIPRYQGDYRLPKKLNQAFIEHYFEAFKVRMLAHQMRAIWAGKAPHHVGIVLGGVTEKPTVDKIIAFIWRLRKVRNFIENKYIPDVLVLEKYYEDYVSLGRGHGNLLSFGGLNQGEKKSLRIFRSGAVKGNSFESFSPAVITEDVLWAKYDEATSGVSPAENATIPLPRKENAYSWIKAPRYRNDPFEVGPLARMWIEKEYQDTISVMSRHKARAFEAKKLASVLEELTKKLELDKSVYTKVVLPDQGRGVGLTEAPRGGLGHWVEIQRSIIKNYQVVTPSAWNFSPRDERGMRGPVEEALIGIPVKDPNNPFEIVRVVRSFDPCSACAVHIIQPKQKMKSFRII